VTFTNTNKHLVGGIIELLRTLGYAPRVTWREDGRAERYLATAKVDFQGDKRVPVFRLARKLERLPAVRNSRHEARAIVSVEPVESRPVQCLAVDNEDHLFLAGEGFVPTHNTHLFVTERTQKAHSTMQRNIPKRYAADAWSLETTTMYGPGEESVAESAHQFALGIAQGRVKSGTLYYDHRQASEFHDITTDAGLTEAVREASGDAWTFTDVDAVISLFRDPKEDENENRRYWLNQPRRSSRRWGLAPLWAPLAEPGFIPEDGAEIVLGFDGSYTRDCTALVGCTIDETPRLFVIRVWERPPGNRAWRVPRLEVKDAVSAAMERWDVQELAPDPPGWVSEIEEWEEAYGDVVVRFDTNQPRRMGPACDDFEQAVRDGAVRHDGSEVLARHLGNCVPITRGSYTWVQKDPNLPEDKIDCAAAAIVALHRAKYHHAHRSEYVDFFVVDPNERPSE
jgi:hypothetical protein